MMAYENSSGLNIHNQYGPRTTGGSQGIYMTDGLRNEYVIDQADQGLQYLFPRGGGIFVFGLDKTYAVGSVTSVKIGGLEVSAATEAAPVYIPASNTGQCVQTGMTSGRLVVLFKKEAGYEDDVLPAFPDYTGQPVVTGVTVTPASKTLAAGATWQATSVNAPSGSNQAVVWYTSDATKATVSSSGLITAVATGSATISARSVSNNAVVGTCAVTVS